MSVSPTSMPVLSLRACLVDGKLDIMRYRSYSRKRRQKSESVRILNSLITKKPKTNHSGMNVHKVRNNRSVKKHKIIVRNDDGEFHDVLPPDTLWYRYYIENPPNNDRLHTIFRNRFRLPYDSFIELVNQCKGDELFVRWTKKDSCGDMPADIRLLLLGTLRYIARGLTFDDLEEATCISAEVHRVFFIHSYYSEAQCCITNML